MSRQILTDQEAARADLLSWTRFLRGHAALTRGMNARLLADHGLTLNDYEVLLHLSRAPEHSLRRVDLVERLLLTPSGITRLLEGLERSGLVARRACEHDARVTYAVLTRVGYEKLREAAKTHLEDIREAFSSRFSKDELELLASLLGRLSEEDDESCEP